MLLSVCGRAAGQGPEVGLQVTGVTGRPAALVGGPVVRFRLGHRDRISLQVGAGVSEHSLAGRGEVLWQFLLAPSARHRPAPYLGGGLAGAVAADTRGWVVLALGLDGNPGGRSGWFAEAGVGGGVRVVLGWRW
jgi:hypothetical protein